MSLASHVFVLMLATSSTPREQVYDVDTRLAFTTALVLMGAATIIDLEKHTWSGTPACTQFAEKLESGLCDPASLNFVDRWVTDNSSRMAMKISDVMLSSMVALPIVAGGIEAVNRDLDSRRLLEDAAVGYKAIAIASFATELFKVAVKRPRPLTYNAAYPDEIRYHGDARLSFPSGHASISFAAATAFAVPWLDRHSTLVGVAGASSAYLAAAAVASLRVAAGKHFVTDVLAGSLIGLGVGLVVTLAHSAPDHAVEPGQTATALSRHDARMPPMVRLGGAF